MVSRLCAPNLEYQSVNPTTQVALFSQCQPLCTSIINVTWIVYQGVINASSNVVQWTPYPQMGQYQNTWFFGRSSPSPLSLTRICLGSNSSNFTATNQLFLANPIIAYWRFEVVYTLPSERSSSALSFVINQPPRNGSCTVAPLNGTTSTPFTLTCSRWQDEDGIKDYSIYSRSLSLLTHLDSRPIGWTVDHQDQTMIAFSSLPTMSLRLPAGQTSASTLQLIVIIRDQQDCVMEVDLPTVVVRADSTETDQLLQSLQTSSSTPGNSPLVQILSSGNQNAVGQVLSSLSQQFNDINTQALQSAADREFHNQMPSSDI